MKNQPDLRYKLVKKVGDSRVSMIETPGSVIYSTDCYTVALRECSKAGYFLTVFRTELLARQFEKVLWVGLPVTTELWLVACKGRLKITLPPRLQPGIDIWFYPFRGFRWPRGTEMYRRVKLIRKLE